MQPQQNSRIDLQELKTQIVRRLGPIKSEHYFSNLSGLLSEKLSKKEFNKFFCQVVGKDNLPLHNQLILSILKNACRAKTPPPVRKVDPSKADVQVTKNSVSNEDAHEQGGFAERSRCENLPLLSNGVLPAPPKRCRSGNRGKSKDRPSPLGPNGKLESVRTTVENGDLAPCDYKRPARDLRVVAEQPDNEVEVLGKKRAKRLRVDVNDWKAEAPVKAPAEAPARAPAEDQDVAERLSILEFFRRPILAPLGIPYCSASVGRSCKNTPVSSTGDSESYHKSGELTDSETLRKRMEQIAVAQGLGGVSMECATLLNNMIDVYLKRLIKPCAELVGARHARGLKQLPLHKQQVQNKIINGTWPRDHMHIQSGNGSMHTLQEPRPQHSISMLDLKVAMELNPQEAGEDWPLQLEKISMKTFEETNTNGFNKFRTFD